MTTNAKSLIPFKVDAHATLSPCGMYRYTLSRDWDAGSGRLLYCMLNPSTADASNDDPTIRRCVGFAKRFGYAGLSVVNLYAYRATKPADLRAFIVNGGDAVGPHNELVQRYMVERARHVVAAWGANAAGHAAAYAFVDLCLSMNKTVFCLGTTGDGVPRHPLMLANSTQMEVFRSVGKVAVRK